MFSTLTELGAAVTIEALALSMLGVDVQPCDATLPSTEVITEGTLLYRFLERSHAAAMRAG